MWKDKDYMKHYREKRKQQGLCILCGCKQDANGLSTCSKCAEKKRIWQRLWRRNHLSEAKMKAKKYNDRLRLKALKIIAARNGISLSCPCGCETFELLEINHIDHNGRDDYGGHSDNLKFYRRIVRGDRDVKDLNIRCKLCNFEYYLERKFSGFRWEVKYLGCGFSPRKKKGMLG